MPDQLSWAMACLLRWGYSVVIVENLLQRHMLCPPPATASAGGGSEKDPACSLRRHRVCVPIKHLPDLVGSRAFRRHSINGADQFAKLCWRHVLTSSGPGQARDVFIDQRAAVIIRPGLQGALREVAV